MPLSSQDSTCRSGSRGICNVCHCWKIRLYTPLHVPILGLIISFSLRKNLQLLSSGPGGGEKSVCDLQSMGWGGSSSGLDNNIWSRDPVLGSSATAAFDLDPAFSFLEDVPIGRGEGGMESSVQMFEIPPILPRCLYLGD